MRRENMCNTGRPKYYQRGDGWGIVKCQSQKCGAEFNVTEQDCPECGNPNPDYEDSLKTRFSAAFAIPGFMKKSIGDGS